MASVDGRESELTSSDEVLQYVCGPCKHVGQTKEAKYLCESCKVYLCFDCKNDHKTLKATKFHSVVSAHQPQRIGSAVIKGTVMILCGCTQKRAVEVYCEEHDDVICPTCQTVKHRNCKTCPIKDKVDKHTQKQFKELMVKGKSLKAEIESCIQNGEANRKSIDKYKDECKKDISAFRIEINKILDKMEEEIIEKLDKTAKQNLLALEKQIANMTASLQALNTDLDVIDSANKTNRDEIMFSAKVKISKSMSEYNDLIQDIRKVMKRPQLKFHKNKKLTDLLLGVDGFGRIEPSETGSAQQDHVGMLDMKVRSTKKVNIELPDDVGLPSITGCTFLSNGRILLCDNKNKKVKLLESDMSVKKRLKFPSGPLNVAAAGENEAIISFSSERHNDLQYIHTHPGLKLGKKITLPDKCRGLQVFNDEIYTTYQQDFEGHYEIWRLDRAGNIMSKIVHTQRSTFYTSSYNRDLCLAGSSPRVYLTDWYYSRVTCFQLDGKTVYQYEGRKQLERPNGIYVDSFGNSLVCGTYSHNVVVITADGRKRGELLTSKKISYPRCIDYRPEDNTLIVGCYENSKLFVYKLGK